MSVPCIGGYFTQAGDLALRGLRAIQTLSGLPQELPKALSFLEASFCVEDRVVVAAGIVLAGIVLTGACVGTCCTCCCMAGSSALTCKPIKALKQAVVAAGFLAIPIGAGIMIYRKIM
jgi:hypothetical protein